MRPFGYFVEILQVWLIPVTEDHNKRTYSGHLCSQSISTSTSAFSRWLPIAVGTSDKVNVTGAAVVLCVRENRELPRAGHDNWLGRNVPDGQQLWVTQAGTAPEGLQTLVSHTGAWALRNSAAGRPVSSAGKTSKWQRAAHTCPCLMCHPPRCRNLGGLSVTCRRTKEIWNLGVARTHLSFSLKMCVLFLNMGVSDQMFVLINDKLSKA